jgi:hypothetical protein
MLEDSLVDLVKHIWGDGDMDISVRKAIPEWLVDAARYVLVHTDFMELRCGFCGILGISNYIRSPGLCMRRQWIGVLKFVHWALAFWACSILGVRDKTLL